MLPFVGLFGVVVVVVVVVAVWVGGGVSIVVDLVESFVDVVASIVGEVLGHFRYSSNGIGSFVVFVFGSGLEVVEDVDVWEVKAVFDVCFYGPFGLSDGVEIRNFRVFLVVESSVSEYEAFFYPTIGVIRDGTVAFQFVDGFLVGRK